MKNTWLRAEEQAARSSRSSYSSSSPGMNKNTTKGKGCKLLQVRDREPVVMTPAQTRPRTVTVPPPHKRVNSETLSPEPTFAVRRDMVIETIRTPYRVSDQRSAFFINSDSSTERKLQRAKKLLEGVMKRDCITHDGIPKPGNHIVRKLEKTEHPTIKRALSVPRFSFIDEDFLTFGTFDVKLRPGWDESVLATADQKEVERRRERVRIMKEKLTEMNAITNTVKEVITSYSKEKMMYIKDCMSFTVPVYLNNHEIHAWRTLSNLLFTYGQSFNLNHMEELADFCGLDDRKDNSKFDLRRFRFQHPEIFHFVCYCNLLLGGTKSFSSARFMLLRDLEILLGLIQRINPLNVPIENIRAASAFRLREAKHMKQLATNTFIGSQHPCQLNHSSTMSSRFSMKSDKPPSWSRSNSSAQSPQVPWDDNTTWASACPSKMTAITVDTVTTSRSGYSIKSANTSVFPGLAQKLSSWTLSFSLLARITLVSAERTPLSELLKTARNKALPDDAREQSLLVKIEDVKVDKNFIMKVISEKQISCSQLPPAVPSEPDLSPSGLFETAPAKQSQFHKSLRRQTLNRQILQKKETGQKKPSENLSDRPRGARQSVVITSDGRGTACLGTSHSETSSKLLAAVRTSNISTNFRNAQALLFAMRNKENGQLNTMMEELSEEDDDDDFSEGLEGVVDIFSEGDGSDDQDDVVGSFMERMAEKRLRKFSDAKSSDGNPLHSPIGSENFHLYTDMMTEAESVEILRKGSAGQRSAVMGALSVRRDKLLEQGKWKETKSDERKQFQKNLDKNKEYIDEVIRMYNLRAQNESEKPVHNDFSIRWKEVLEKNRKNLSNDSIMRQRSISSPEQKILAMLKTQEVKQDRVSLRGTDSIAMS